MTKKQKIWLAIFLAMFIVPEIIWSPISNYLYAFINNKSFHDSILMSSSYKSALIAVMLFQFLGIILSIALMSKGEKYKNIKEGRVLLFLLAIIGLISFSVIYILLATK